MHISVSVTRRTITVIREGGSPKVTPLGAKSKFPLFMATLRNLAEPPRTVPLHLVWQSEGFRHLEDEEDFLRYVHRYADQMAKALGDDSDSVRLELGGVPGKRWLRIAVEPEADLDVAMNLVGVVEQGRVSESSPPWLALPRHNAKQLRKLAHTISDAAKLFDVGSGNEAAKPLVAALKVVTEPRYLAVILFRLARARLRSGAEDAAKTNVHEAEQLIKKLRPTDPILTARALYNRAWIAYTNGDFGFEHIHRAEDALLLAGPDDLRRGFVATLHGLIGIKSIERTHYMLTDARLHEKVQEALTYLAHAVYLLVRSEDFWGAQESCWNLAYALYSLSQIPSHVVQHEIGSTVEALAEAEEWIVASDAIAEKHGTGRDSVRNLVLRARIAMAQERFEDSRSLFMEAREASRATSHSPRERGRTFEASIDLFLLLEERDPDNVHKHRKTAVHAYDEAERIWRKAGLEGLIKNDLEDEYKKENERIRKKVRSRRPY